ncbi:aspartate kinase [Phenylobacterium zucineum HLK1]|uniref:Aspartokinase n=1 Tax=Phenylobacterium zucineum (strain HLK1) TaxID=450851 RepID=B4R983_PHEZH|nr:aspartate kinase [Phenylobacterium zucineum]ACG77753.1 aspartate kinase [Phenylobacterium zucineum HLK1]
MGVHTVEKIGGTSISDTRAVLDNILIGARTGAELYNRIFVVSAYAGVTDRLLEHKKTGRPGVYALFAAAASGEGEAWRTAIDDLLTHLRALNAERFTDPADLAAADAFVEQRVETARSCLGDLQRLCAQGHFRLDAQLGAVREMLASIGEAQSAHNLTLELRRRGVNARMVDLTGWDEPDAVELDELLARAFADVDLASELPIATGYAKAGKGLMAEYGRGYSEVVFSRTAVVTGAREATIHKEFHLSSADPKLVGPGAVRKVGRTNYDVADQLANLGMEAIHPRAARGLRQAGIPLCVRNTFDPEDRGTTIWSDFVSEQPRVEIICGLTGLTALELFEPDMVGVKGYDAGILAVLTRHAARIVSKASNANTISHYLDATPKQVKRVIADLEREFPNATVTTQQVAVVAVIGSDLNIPGLTAAAAQALADAGVEILGIQQLTRRVDLQFVVRERDYAASVQALHARLVCGGGRLRSAA